MSSTRIKKTYAELAFPHLNEVLEKNQKTLQKIHERLVKSVKEGESLFIFGSGHSALFPMELYHRAGGASFVIPLVADFLLPTAGPPIVRVLERTEGLVTPLLNRALPKKGEMIWIASQSGINAAGIDMALLAQKRGMRTVAFTSVVHSKALSSRHPSGKRLFEICDETVDLGGRVGDAIVSVSDDLYAGPLSTLSLVFLGHSLLVGVCSDLEKQGISCIYTSVNTPEGEKRNRQIEEKASVRDPLLR